jgi:hypothetical protein
MTTWRKAVEARFADRSDLGREGLRQQFWRDLPEAEVRAALELVEAEANVRPGLLRPDDRLHDLFRSPSTKNPFRWLEFQTRSSDGLLEISYQLNKQLRTHGTVDEWGDKVYTLDEFVRAWCGLSRVAVHAM